MFRFRYGECSELGPVQTLDETEARVVQKQVTCQLYRWERPDYPTDTFVYLFSVSIVDSSLVGKPREKSETNYHTVKMGMTYELRVNWGLDNEIADTNLRKVLFEYCREHVRKRTEQGLPPEERIVLTTENSSDQCPYDISRIDDSTIPISETINVYSQDSIQETSQQTIIHTDGGAYIEGDVNTGEFTGRDKSMAISSIAPSAGWDLVNQVKEYMSDDHHRIKLDDLVTQEIRRALSLLSDEEFSVRTPPVTPEALSHRLKQYERIASDLQKIAMLLAHWADQEYRHILQKMFVRITDIETSTGGISIWLHLRWYPATVLMYSAGIGAIAADNYDNLASVLTTRSPHGSGSRLVPFEEREIVLSVVEAMGDLDLAKTFDRLPGHEQYYVPRSEYLFKLLQPTLDDLLFLGRNYETTFDRFEILLALVYADVANRRQKNPRFLGPLGRFVWKHQKSAGDPNVFTDFLQEAESQGDNWPPLRAGLFSGSYQRFAEVESGFSQIFNHLHWW